MRFTVFVYRQFSLMFWGSILIILLGMNTVYAKDRLVVAIDKTYAPMSLVTPAGKPEGVLVELWKLWSEQTGMDVEFVSGTWEQTLEMVKSGQADVHSGLFKNSERAGWLLFSDPLYSIKSVFIIGQTAKSLL